MKKTVRTLLATILATACLAAPALAAYPEKPIRLVVPFPPGGSTDVVARIVALKAQTLLGQSIVIENKGGAGAIIGTDQVAKAAPDGYTILLAQTSHAANPSLMKSLPYDTEKDFTAIALLADHPGVLLTHPSRPYTTFADYVKFAKANEGKVNFASAGNGTWPHLTMELLANQAGLQMVHVPYNGAGPSRIDLIAGRVDVKVEAYATSAEFIKDGRLRAIAVTGKSRIPELPNVPTIAESGYPGFDSSIWMGILGPANMPADVTARLERAFTEASRDPGVVKQLSEQGIYSRGLPGTELRTLIRGDVQKWRRVAKAANIVAE